MFLILIYYKNEKLFISKNPIYGYIHVNVHKTFTKIDIYIHINISESEIAAFLMTFNFILNVFAQ